MSIATMDFKTGSDLYNFVVRLLGTTTADALVDGSLSSEGAEEALNYTTKTMARKAQSFRPRGSQFLGDLADRSYELSDIKEQAAFAKYLHDGFLGTLVLLNAIKDKAAGTSSEESAVPPSVQSQTPKALEVIPELKGLFDNLRKHLTDITHLKGSISKDLNALLRDLADARAKDVEEDSPEETALVNDVLARHRERMLKSMPGSLSFLEKFYEECPAGTPAIKVLEQSPVFTDVAREQMLMALLHVRGEMSVGYARGVLENSAELLARAQEKLQEAEKAGADSGTLSTLRKEVKRLAAAPETRALVQKVNKDIEALSEGTLVPSESQWAHVLQGQLMGLSHDFGRVLNSQGGIDIVGHPFGKDNVPAIVLGSSDKFIKETLGKAHAGLTKMAEFLESLISRSLKDETSLDNVKSPVIQGRDPYITLGDPTYTHNRLPSVKVESPYRHLETEFADSTGPSAANKTTDLRKKVDRKIAEIFGIPASVKSKSLQDVGAEWEKHDPEKNPMDNLRGPLLKAYSVLEGLSDEKFNEMNKVAEAFAGEAIPQINEIKRYEGVLKDIQQRVSLTFGENSLIRLSVDNDIADVSAQLENKSLEATERATLEARLKKIQDERENSLQIGQFVKAFFMDAILKGVDLEPTSPSFLTVSSVLDKIVARKDEIKKGDFGDILTNLDKGSLFVNKKNITTMVSLIDEAASLLQELREALKPIKMSMETIQDGLHELVRQLPQIPTSKDLEYALKNALQIPSYRGNITGDSSAPTAHDMMGKQAGMAIETALDNVRYLADSLRTFAAPSIEAMRKGSVHEAIKAFDENCEKSGGGRDTAAQMYPLYQQRLEALKETKGMSDEQREEVQRKRVEFEKDWVNQSSQYNGIFSFVNTQCAPGELQDYITSYVNLTKALAPVNKAADLASKLGDAVSRIVRDALGLKASRLKKKMASEHLRGVVAKILAGDLTDASQLIRKYARDPWAGVKAPASVPTIPNEITGKVDPLTSAKSLFVSMDSVKDTLESIVKGMVDDTSIGKLTDTIVEARESFTEIAGELSNSTITFFNESVSRTVKSAADRLGDILDFDMGQTSGGEEDQELRSIRRNKDARLLQEAIVLAAEAVKDTAAYLINQQSTYARELSTLAVSGSNNRQTVDRLYSILSTIPTDNDTGERYINNERLGAQRVLGDVVSPITEEDKKGRTLRGALRYVVQVARRVGDIDAINDLQAYEKTVAESSFRKRDLTSVFLGKELVPSLIHLLDKYQKALNTDTSAKDKSDLQDKLALLKGALKGIPNFDSLIGTVKRKLLGDDTPDVQSPEEDSENFDRSFARVGTLHAEIMSRGVRSAFHREAMQALKGKDESSAKTLSNMAHRSPSLKSTLKEFLALSKEAPASGSPNGKLLGAFGRILSKWPDKGVSAVVGKITEMDKSSSAYKWAAATALRDGLTKFADGDFSSVRDALVSGVLTDPKVIADDQVFNEVSEFITKDMHLKAADVLADARTNAESASLDDIKSNPKKFQKDAEDVADHLDSLVPPEGDTLAHKIAKEAIVQRAFHPKDALQKNSESLKGAIKRVMEKHAVGKGGPDVSMEEVTEAMKDLAARVGTTQYLKTSNFLDSDKFDDKTADHRDLTPVASMQSVNAVQHPGRAHVRAVRNALDGIESRSGRATPATGKVADLSELEERIHDHVQKFDGKVEASNKKLDEISDTIKQLTRDKVTGKNVDDELRDAQKHYASVVKELEDHQHNLSGDLNKVHEEFRGDYLNKKLPVSRENTDLNEYADTVFKNVLKRRKERQQLVKENTTGEHDELIEHLSEAIDKDLRKLHSFHGNAKAGISGIPTELASDAVAHFKGRAQEMKDKAAAAAKYKTQKGKDPERAEEIRKAHDLDENPDISALTLESQKLLAQADGIHKDVLGGKSSLSLSGGTIEREVSHAGLLGAGHGDQDYRMPAKMMDAEKTNLATGDIEYRNSLSGRPRKKALTLSTSINGGDSRYVNEEASEFLTNWIKFVEERGASFTGEEGALEKFIEIALEKFLTKIKGSYTADRIEGTDVNGVHYKGVLEELQEKHKYWLRLAESLDQTESEINTSFHALLEDLGTLVVNNKATAKAYQGAVDKFFNSEDALSNKQRMEDLARANGFSTDEDGNPISSTEAEFAKNTLQDVRDTKALYKISPVEYAEALRGIKKKLSDMGDQKLSGTKHFTDIERAILGPELLEKLESAEAPIHAREALDQHHDKFRNYEAEGRALTDKLHILNRGGEDAKELTFSDEEFDLMGESLAHKVKAIQKGTSKEVLPHVDNTIARHAKAMQSQHIESASRSLAASRTDTPLGRVDFMLQQLEEMDGDHQTTLSNIKKAFEEGFLTAEAYASAVSDENAEFESVTGGVKKRIERGMSKIRKSAEKLGHRQHKDDLVPYDGMTLDELRQTVERIRSTHEGPFGAAEMIKLNSLESKLAELVNLHDEEVADLSSDPTSRAELLKKRDGVSKQVAHLVSELKESGHPLASDINDVARFRASRGLKGKSSEELQEIVGTSIDTIVQHVESQQVDFAKKLRDVAHFQGEGVRDVRAAVEEGMRNTVETLHEATKDIRRGVADSDTLKVFTETLASFDSYFARYLSAYMNGTAKRVYSAAKQLVAKLPALKADVLSATISGNGHNSGLAADEVTKKDLENVIELEESGEHDDAKIHKMKRAVLSALVKKFSGSVKKKYLKGGALSELSSILGDFPNIAHDFPREFASLQQSLGEIQSLANERLEGLLDEALAASKKHDNFKDQTRFDTLHMLQGVLANKEIRRSSSPAVVKKLADATEALGKLTLDTSKDISADFAKTTEDFLAVLPKLSGSHEEYEQVKSQAKGFSEEIKGLLAAIAGLSSVEMVEIPDGLANTLRRRFGQSAPAASAGPAALLSFMYSVVKGNFIGNAELGKQDELHGIVRSFLDILDSANASEEKYKEVKPELASIAKRIAGLRSVMGSADLNSLALDSTLLKELNDRMRDRFNRTTSDVKVWSPILPNDIGRIFEVISEVTRQYTPIPVQVSKKASGSDDAGGSYDRQSNQLQETQRRYPGAPIDELDSINGRVSSVSEHADLREQHKAMQSFIDQYDHLVHTFGKGKGIRDKESRVDHTFTPPNAMEDTANNVSRALKSFRETTRVRKGHSPEFDDLSAQYHAARTHEKFVKDNGGKVSEKQQALLNTIKNRWDKMKDSLASANAATEKALNDALAGENPSATVIKMLQEKHSQAAENLVKHAEITRKGADYAGDETHRMLKDLHVASMGLEKQMEKTFELMGEAGTGYKGGTKIPVKDALNHLMDMDKAFADQKTKIRNAKALAKKEADRLEDLINGWKSQLSTAKANGGSGLDAAQEKMWSSLFLGQVMHWVMWVWERNKNTMEKVFDARPQDYTKFLEMHQAKLGVFNNPRVSKAIGFVSETLENNPELKTGKFRTENQKAQVHALLRERKRLFLYKYSLSHMHTLLDSVMQVVKKHDLEGVVDKASELGTALKHMESEAAGVAAEFVQDANALSEEMTAAVATSPQGTPAPAVKTAGMRPSTSKSLIEKVIQRFTRGNS